MAASGDFLLEVASAPLAVGLTDNAPTGRRGASHPPAGADDSSFGGNRALVVGGRLRVGAGELCLAAVRVSAGCGDSHVWVPAIDVVEHKDAYVLYAELPGVDATDVNITFEQNVLTISGAKRSLVESGDHRELRVFAAERTSGRFERVVRLPEFVDRDNIDAELHNGLLVVRVPKAQAARPRRIDIKPRAQSGEISGNDKSNN